MKTYARKGIHNRKWRSPGGGLQRSRISPFMWSISTSDSRMRPEFDYFEIKRGDVTEELGEPLDLARAEMTKMTQKQDVMIEKLDDNTSVLKDFKNDETNENLGKLTNIIITHDSEGHGTGSPLLR